MPTARTPEKIPDSPEYRTASVVVTRGKPNGRVARTRRSRFESMRATTYSQGLRPFPKF